MPDKLKGNPSKRPRNKYYRFHLDYGHDTSECYDLKQQIENLIKQGKLQWFVRGGENPPRNPEPNQWVEERPRALLKEIRIIVGGNTMQDHLKRQKRHIYIWCKASKSPDGLLREKGLTTLSSTSQKTTLGDYTTLMMMPWLSTCQLQISIPDEF